MVRAGVVMAALLIGSSGVLGGPWPQFRGPNASAVADDARLPAQLGPTQNVLWKTPLPAGHSSPVVHGNRVYVTAAREQAMLTIALESGNGKILWQAECPGKAPHFVHKIGSHAQPTPATDGDVVVSLFGSSGLWCHDSNGKLLWQLPLGPFKNDFGAGASPIIVGDRVILNQDHDTDSFLAALDKRSGKVLWKADRAEFPRSYATPVIWEVGGKKQIVVPGTLRVIAYDFDTGKEIWVVKGIARIINMSPTVGPDGILYVPTWAPGGDDTDRIQVAPFDEMLGKHDANKNGTLEENEVPAGPIKERFTQVDRDKDTHITRIEFESMRAVFHEARNIMIAIKPGGSGDITNTHVLWGFKKFLPYVPSPVLYRDHLFMVKNGGIITAVDARTGQPAKSERGPASGNYFSSPVAGDGKVYLIGERGDVTVISAEPQWQVLSRSRLEEDCFSTPAIADGRIFVRTNKHLWCFGVKEQ